MTIMRYIDAMLTDPDGRWVKADDFDALTSENRRLRDALATLWCVLEKHPALFAEAQKAVEARGKP
jgi:hypothetical protein